MILSDRTIQKMLSEKSLVIEPLEKEQIQPASVDVRLGNTFSIVEDSYTGVITLGSKSNIRPYRQIPTCCFQVSLFLPQLWNILNYQTI